MLDDIVVDTNVFAHSSDPRNSNFNLSLEFVEALINVDTKVVVDEVFCASEAQNTSAIFSEYLQHLSGFELAASIIASLIQSDRIIDVPTRVDQRSRQIITQGVRDPSDRKYVKVTINSEEKILVSNDVHDFTDRFRRTATRELGIRILGSDQVAGLL